MIHVLNLKWICQIPTSELTETNIPDFNFINMCMRRGGGTGGGGGAGVSVIYQELGGCLSITMLSYQYGIPIVKIKRSHDYLMLIMEILIPPHTLKDSLHIEMKPRCIIFKMWIQWVDRHKIRKYNRTDGFVQDCSISSVLTMEILQSCTKPSIYSVAVFYLGSVRPTNDCINILYLKWYQRHHSFDGFHVFRGTHPCDNTC